MPTPSAHIHEATSAGDARGRCAAANTITAELLKPTRTVTKPATTAARERARKKVTVWQRNRHLQSGWRIPRGTGRNAPAHGMSTLDCAAGHSHPSPAVLQ